MSPVLTPIVPPARREDRELERARAAWLLAIDLADNVGEAGFARIYTMPGKVGRGSDARTTLGRKLACYLAVVVGNCTEYRVAKVAGLHHSSVHHHVRAVTDLRDDDPVMDRLLDELERALIRRAASLVMANLGEAA